MFFMISIYTRKLDSKFRLTIPFKFYEKFKYIGIDSLEFDYSLELRDKKLKKENWNKKTGKLQRVILNNFFKAKINALGKIFLSKQLLDLVKIKNEIILIDIGDKVEIHDSKKCNLINSNLEIIEKLTF
ncbi:MAG: hypothetical protein TYPL_2150 [Candidatus Tyloplasma litorale]|nr:MAG: hypothetical protein TYPL_2150 [Mycoplasmatales bacterium]